MAYGSGAGSDAFDITVTPAIRKFRKEAAPSVRDLVENKKFLDYASYAKVRGKIRMKEASQ